MPRRVDEDEERFFASLNLQTTITTRSRRWLRAHRELAEWLQWTPARREIDLIASEVAEVRHLVSVFENTGGYLTPTQTRRLQNLYDTAMEFELEEDEDDEGADDLWRFWEQENRDVVTFLEGWDADEWHAHIGGARGHTRRMDLLRQQVRNHHILRASDIQYVHRRIRQWRNVTGLDAIEQAAVDAAVQAAQQAISETSEPRMSEVTGRHPQ